MLQGWAFKNNQPAKLVFIGFIGCDHVAALDFTYIGELVVHVGQEVLELNMLGMSQYNCTDARKDVKAKQNKTKVGTFELFFFQHNTLRRAVGFLLADNKIVTTL